MGSLLYVSYIQERVRIFVYNIGTGKQRLVTESTNPTFAPRWSPDGRSILFSDGDRWEYRHLPRVSAGRRAGAPHHLTRHRCRRQLLAGWQPHRVRERPLGQPANLRHER
jgi:dipeptidyl aminopeptidase/acylaminoacyl peptidase